MVLPLGLSKYLSWTPGPFSLTAVLCPDFLTPYAISGLGRITVPDDIKSGFPCSAKEPGDVTWKGIKALNIRKYEKRARLTDKLPSPSPFCGLLQGVAPLPLPWTAPRQTSSVQFIRRHQVGEQNKPAG